MMSEKLVVIHQPDFLPYLGFFDRLIRADIYVVFDNVQFVYGSRSWTNRDKIKTKQGAKWITVATQKCPRDTKIQDVLIQENGDWKSRHLNILTENYKEAGYYKEIMPYMQKLYTSNTKRLMDFNMASIKMLMELLDIDIEIVYASHLGVTGKSNELLVDIMHKLGAKKYLSGVGAKDYYKPEVFEKADIEVIWQQFAHPVYKQLYGDFIPYLSTIDLLFNCGIQESRKILRGENV